MDNVKTLCELNMGSRLYHLETPTSDFDKRSIFLNQGADYILGTRRFDEARKQNSVLKLDVIAKELSHWVRLLSQANTEALEMLFAPRSEFTVYETEFDAFRQNSVSFLDSRKLFNALRGYAQSEHSLATGRRTGRLGSLRAEALAKYSFSPKNVVQLLRLLQCGIRYYREDVYTVDCRDFGPTLHAHLMAIKTNPASYSLERFEVEYKETEAELVSAYEARKVTRYFDEALANRMLLMCYYPALKTAYES